jgi:hypothetical protein
VSRAALICQSQRREAGRSMMQAPSPWGCCPHTQHLAQGLNAYLPRETAKLCASQHAHAAGSAVALDDGQALVLD